MRRITTAAVCAAVVVGCTAGAEEVAPDGPPAPAEVRHDSAGLAEVFPAIGVPESVSWVAWSGLASGTGDTTVRWTDAVVRLAPAVVDALIAQFEPTDIGQLPMVQEILRDQVPAGPFLTGESLDAGFESAATTTYAYLDPKASTLVLQATSLG